MNVPQSPPPRTTETTVRRDPQRLVFQLAIDGLVDLDPLITHGLPLDDYPDALDMIRRGDGLKIQLLPNG
jgi:threonine dehydrogenase-like Zn-dependent dehydrogenase